MKQLIIILIIIALATPAAAASKCYPRLKKLYRSASGRNVAHVGWKCDGKFGMDVRINEICGITDDGKIVCGLGYKRFTVTTGKTIKVEFQNTEYPIKKIVVK